MPQGPAGAAGTPGASCTTFPPRASTKRTRGRAVLPRQAQTDDKLSVCELVRGTGSLAADLKSLQLERGERVCAGRPGQIARGRTQTPSCSAMQHAEEARVALRRCGADKHALPHPNEPRAAAGLAASRVREACMRCCGTLSVMIKPQKVLSIPTAPLRATREEKTWSSLI